MTQPSEALAEVMEKQTTLTSSDEEKPDDDKDVDDEDMVSFDEFIFASQGHAFISLSSHKTICSLKPAHILLYENLGPPPETCDVCWF